MQVITWQNTTQIKVSKETCTAYSSLVTCMVLAWNFNYHGSQEWWQWMFEMFCRLKYPGLWIICCIIIIDNDRMCTISKTVPVCGDILPTILLSMITVHHLHNHVHSQSHTTNITLFYQRHFITITVIVVGSNVLFCNILCFCQNYYPE